MAIESCPKCGAGDEAMVGIEVLGVYDGVLYWRCGRCGWAQHRWPEGHDYRKRAQRYLDQDNSEPPLVK